MMHNFFQRIELLSYDGRGKLSSLKSKVLQDSLLLYSKILGLQAKCLLKHFNFFYAFLVIRKCFSCNAVHLMTGQCHIWQDTGHLYFQTELKTSLLLCLKYFLLLFINVAVILFGGCSLYYLASEALKHWYLT